MSVIHIVVGISLFCNKMEETGINSVWVPDTQTMSRHQIAGVRENSKVSEGQRQVHLQPLLSVLAKSEPGNYMMCNSSDHLELGSQNIKVSYLKPLPPEFSSKDALFLEM